MMLTFLPKDLQLRSSSTFATNSLTLPPTDQLVSDQVVSDQHDSYGLLKSRRRIGFYDSIIPSTSYSTTI